MKRMNFVIILSILNCTLCLAANAMPAADSSIATYPLQVGNLWQYYTYDYFNGKYTWLYGWTEKVIGDTIMPNNNKYSTITTDQILGRTMFWRQESSKVYLYWRGKDSLLYDFSNPKYNIYVVKPVSNNDTLFQIVKDQGYNEYFGQYRQYWTFEFYFANVTYYEEKDIVDGLGMTYLIREGGDEWFLTGAVINGIKYGTITDVQDHDKLLGAASFELYPNYPNPFNPSTTLSFSLPTKSQVTLKIFDVMGRDVATIISDELPAGIYQRQWNASGMPSGVYFYRLQAGSYTETKRLLLLR